MTHSGNAFLNHCFQKKLEILICNPNIPNPLKYVITIIIVERSTTHPKKLKTKIEWQMVEYKVNHSTTKASKKKSG